MRSLVLKDDFDYPVADDGILILNNDPDVDSFRMGMDICEALQTDDTIVEFEITNNRPDCLSVLGLAQEASATFDIPMNYHVIYRIGHLMIGFNL